MPMGVLTRDISLVGTISQREEALSKIDWDEEKRKRMEERERIALGEEQAQTQAERDEALARLQEAANTAAASAQAPQMRVVNGVVMLDHSSTQVDRNARAREDAEELQEIEEDELTTRVNQMSWIKANRKDPRERTSWGPTRADRWSEEQTDMFYDALKMFGTDFFIISKMFPGKTRANVKRKFVKEERLDPDRIKRALIGESVPMDFEEYKRKTGKDDDFFRDPEQLRQELAQETEQQRQEVEEAQARYAEQQRQRKLAKQGGADVDGEEGEGGKKGRKKKGEGKKGKKSKAPIGGEEIEVVEFEGDELEHRR
ncbi:Transcription factor TFIIIB component B'' [Lasiodiplodia hormozganensis]|nr:Transcription factor TFIIIB component B'' [Lasiodiplodia hormozganensis]